MDRRAFLVGLLLEEYRRIWIDHEVERLGLECEVGDSSLIDLAVGYGVDGPRRTFWSSWAISSWSCAKRSSLKKCRSMS